ncbi:MAG: ketopantoate reductase family protein [Candidatus Bathyarchaeota archaeon]|nr:MAG: ketopantoate reductase family protein [Candidatus Bathyarchaeota archaeon]
MAEKRPTVAVIGLGPVGSILAAHLANNGETVIGEDVMTDLLRTIDRDGLKISGFTTLNARVSKTVNSIAELSEAGPEIIFISTKACILNAILPELKEILTPHMKIVSFQNGLGNEQLLADTLEVDTTYRVVVNYAGNKTSLGSTVMNWFQPPNYVGAYHRGTYVIDETTKVIAEMMTAAGLDTKEHADVKKVVWEKTILNSTLCSICAVTGQMMKEAMENFHTLKLAEKVLEEGLAVAKADGYDFGEEALDRFVAYLEKGGAHKPSMLIDVERRRPTEVDFMSGAVVLHGQKHNVPTPVNSVLTSILKGIESKYAKN